MISGWNIFKKIEWWKKEKSWAAVCIHYHKYIYPVIVEMYIFKIFELSEADLSVEFDHSI